MLSIAHKAIVTATVPLLESGGEALTTHFYRIMLDEYPEVRPLFNQANQASGAQPRALANAVLMYARNIDRLEALGDLATRIVQKHVALQILPEHYPIVGACLLRAIRDVLGAEIATDAVIEAWGAAYGQLADILIGAEAAEYDRKAAAPGGWRGARAFRVDRKEAESDEITSFYLKPVDGLALLDFEPGQYIGLRLDIDGQEVRRNYSLSAAANGQAYRISVKRQPGGIASSYLHDRVQVGSILELFPPAGEFTLVDNDRPLVLISGGVGITPTFAMLQAALIRTPARRVCFIHCARSTKVHAFHLAVEEMARRHPNVSSFYCYEEASAINDPSLAAHAIGRIGDLSLAQWLPPAADGVRDVDAFFLGPKPFMQQVRRSLHALGVPDRQARHEFFGPASALD